MVLVAGLLWLEDPSFEVGPKFSGPKPLNVWTRKKNVFSVLENIQSLTQGE